MKKYYGISILIHSIPLVFILLSIIFKPIEKEKEKQKQEQTLIEFNPVVIEQSQEKSTEPIKEHKNFYWGLGFVQDLNFVKVYGLPTYGYTVTQVYSGYCGETAGLSVGDYIYLVNGAVVSDGNDIRGDGPKKLILTILRNGGTVLLTIDRCKVYY